MRFLPAQIGMAIDAFGVTALKSLDNNRDIWENKIFKQGQIS